MSPKFSKPNEIFFIGYFNIGFNIKNSFIFIKLAKKFRFGARRSTKSDPLSKTLSKFSTIFLIRENCDRMLAFYSTAGHQFSLIILPRTTPGQFRQIIVAPIFVAPLLKIKKLIAFLKDFGDACSVNCFFLILPKSPKQFFSVKSADFPFDDLKSRFFLRRRVALSFSLLASFSLFTKIW